ncbi:MAG: lysostaphin resistance A-like protein [Opitutales bacterium]
MQGVVEDISGDLTQPEESAEARPVEDALFPLIAFAIGAYLAWLWRSDLLARRQGEEAKGALPGTTLCKPVALYIASAGALVLLGLQIVGEYGLGIVAEQTDIAWLFLLQMMAAAVVEEVIFRGYLVVQNKGKAVLWGGIVTVSLVFAVGHPHLWTLDFPDGVSAWEFWKGDFELHFDTKAIYSTSWLFVMSLWFYFVRFATFNLERSLLPCMVAHLIYNLGVFVTKLLQGHVVGLY